MKNLLYTCTLFGVMTILISSCQDKANKIIFTFHENGEKFEEYQYIADSLKHGIYKQFSQEGVLVETAHYINGKLDGERIIYNFRTGVKEISEIYKNDLLDGRHIVFHPNGEIQSIGMYDKNVLSGMLRIYDTSGVMKDEFKFVNNFEIIDFKEYHENGNIKWEGTKRYDHFFKIKKDYGLLKEYDEEGQLIRKIMCDENEICTTTWSIDGSHLK